MGRRDHATRAPPWRRPTGRLPGRAAWAGLLAAVLLATGSTTSLQEGQDPSKGPSRSHAVAPYDVAVMPGPNPAPAALSPGVQPYAVTVEGEVATGLVAVPAMPPTALVVIAHGWGQDAQGQASDLAHAMDLGAVAVAMDYRGPREAFKIEAGVADTVAATRDLQARFPTVRGTLVLGFSMGGAVALLAPLAAPADTYDMVVSGAGVGDLGVLWNETIWMRTAIEAEVGGTPLEVPAEYADRSPARPEQAHALAQAGVGRVLLLHGVADDIVPPWHASAVYDALVAAGQPVSTYAILRDDGRLCDPALLCPPGPAPAGHAAGRFSLMRPFVDPLLAELAAGGDLGQVASAPWTGPEAGTFQQASFDVVNGAIVAEAT